MRRTRRRMPATKSPTLRQLFRSSLLVLFLLLGGRVALPTCNKVVRHRTLDRTEGYEGRIDDVDVALIRGAYRIDGVARDPRSLVPDRNLHLPRSDPGSRSRPRSTSQPKRRTARSVAEVV